MKKKYKNKKLYILSFIISLCFFLTFIVTKEKINTILAVLWTLIGIVYLRKYKKLKNKLM